MAKEPKKLKSLEDLPPDAAATDAAETIDETIEALRGTAAALSGNEDPNVKEIEDMLKSNDLEGGTLRLSRRGPLDSGFAYIGKFRVKEFDIEQIKKVYGGGDYQAQTFRANGQMGKKVSFSIDPRFKGVIVDEKGAIGSPGGGMDMSMLPRLIDALKPAPVAPDTSFKEMMALMQQSSEKNMMMMMQMMQNSTQVMVAAMQTIGTRPESKPDNTALTAMMPVLIEMIRQQKGGSGLTETISAMKAVKELMTGEGGEPGEGKEEDSFGMKLLKALGPTLLPVLAGAPAQRTVSQGALPAAHPTARPPAQPTAQPGASEPTAQAHAPAQTTSTEQAIGMFAVQLVRAAEAESDPGLYHDLIADALTPEQMQQLGVVLAQDNYLEQIYGAQPDILARAKIKVRWFEGLRSMLLDSLKGEQHDQSAAQSPSSESGQEGS